MSPRQTRRTASQAGGSCALFALETQSSDDAHVRKHVRLCLGRGRRGVGLGAILTDNVSLRKALEAFGEFMATPFCFAMMILTSTRS